MPLLKLLVSSLFSQVSLPWSFRVGSLRIDSVLRDSRMSSKSLRIARDYLTFLKKVFFEIDEENQRALWIFVGENDFPVSDFGKVHAFERKFFFFFFFFFLIVYSEFLY
jgi:hypothetical protein